MFRWLALFLCLAAPAAAREVTDDAGHRVAVPGDPQRVVSLHDWSLTVMLHELGVPLAGSSYRVAADGTRFMRGASDLFGLGEDEVPLASVHGQIDAERIAALNPDLILGNLGDVAAQRDQLAAIAPVLLFDPETDEAPMDRYRRVAEWLGRGTLFEAKLGELEALALPSRGCSWALANASARDGTLDLARHYGAVEVAAGLAGLAPSPALEMVPEGRDRAALSPEVAGAIAPDVLFTTFLASRGETAESARQAFDTVAPGYLAFLEGRGSRVIALPRETFYPASLTGAARLLDSLPDALPEHCRP
ncbi:ABC transporter substrate-binding protein [Mangrovicoccus algicola]|uniref:ABC transporter substrate-binding protein n=1 Tax=Mangrovicoccus algicola TaxID=2771008 RepID=A0A8J6Z460_9RHOB|nr:ABC transporter substrate-binding protein [Mangrovicoccus algicola]MBE3637194.1 ABC transporter substrate-binding protein [Mangrovicoccus algicola]